MFINGAHYYKRSRLGVIILDHNGNFFEYPLRMDFQVTENFIEYKEAIFEPMTLKKLKANNVILHSNSRLVVNQYLGTFEAKHSTNVKVCKAIERRIFKFL